MSKYNIKATWTWNWFHIWIVILRIAPCFCNSFFTASFRSHARRKELSDYIDEGNGGIEKFQIKHEGELNQSYPLDESYSSSPNLAKSFSDTQLEIFHHRHGILILHLVAALMFFPSLVAWFQVCATISFSFSWKWYR